MSRNRFGLKRFAQNQNKSAARSSRRRPALQWEGALEDRRLLATLTLTPANNIDYLAGVGFSNTLTVRIVGGNYVFEDSNLLDPMVLVPLGGTSLAGAPFGPNGFSISTVALTQNITVRTLDGDDTVNIQDIAATTASTFVDTDLGLNDLINLGNPAGKLDTILGPVAMTDAGSGGIAFNDGSSAVATTYTLDTIAGPQARLRLSTQPTTVLTWDNFFSNGITLNGGSGSDTYAVDNTLAGQILNLNLDGGNDTTRVSATAAGSIVNIDSQVGVPDQTTVGSVAAGVTNILGTVNVVDAGGVGALVVDDTGNAGGRTWTLGAAGIIGNVGWGGTGLITYGTGIDTVSLNGGSGVDNVTINNTGNAALLVTASGNDGADVLTLNGASSPVELNGNNGTDTFNLNATGFDQTSSGGNDNDLFSINVAGVSFANSFFNGNAGDDTFNVNFTPGATLTDSTFRIDGGTNTPGNRNVVNMAADVGLDATARSVALNWTGGSNLTAGGSGLISFLSSDIQTTNTQQVNYIGGAANNDHVTVTGTAGDDVISVTPLSATSGNVFLGGSPMLLIPPGSPATNNPGITGGGSSPDIYVGGVDPNVVPGPNGLTINGGGTGANGDQLVVNGSTENLTGEAATSAWGQNPFSPIGSAVYPPGLAYDTISVSDTQVSVVNNFFLIGQLLRVNINQAGPNQIGHIVVNSGEEAVPGGGGIADDITVTSSPIASYQINGGQPVPGFAPNGDRLNLLANSVVNVWSDKSTPPNVTFQEGTLKPIGTNSIENFNVWATTVNFYGNNNNATVDQQDYYTIVGTGYKQFTGVINGSVPINFNGVSFLNAYGDDSTMAPGVAVDTLNITPYADNTPQGWGVATYFNEGLPVNDGPGADLIIYNGIVNVSEDITVFPSGLQNGQIVTNMGLTGTPISVINFIANTDIIFQGNNAGGQADTDTLTLSGSDAQNPGVAWDQTVIADFSAAGTPLNPKIIVNDPTSTPFYHVENFTNYSSVTIDMGLGNDLLQLVGTAGNDSVTATPAGAPLARNLLVALNATAPMLVHSKGIESVVYQGNGGTDSLTMNGLGGDDLFAMSDTQVKQNDGPIIDFSAASVTAVNLQSGAGTNTVNYLGGLSAYTVDASLATPTLTAGLKTISLGGIRALNLLGTAGGDTLSMLGTAGDDRFDIQATSAGQGDGMATLGLLSVGSKNFTNYVLNGMPGGFDQVNILGTNGVDNVSSTATVVTINGATVDVGTNLDQLAISTQGGDDNVTLSLGVAGLAKRVDGGDGNDTINLSAVTTDATIIGGAGDDTLTGSPTADWIEGGSGNDNIAALGGDDTVYGGQGNDLINGGTGNDALFGDEDQDTFLWNDGDGSDDIEGGSGQDQVRVTGDLVNAESYQIAAVAGLVRLSRTSAPAFTLDIASVQSIGLNTGGGNDDVIVGDLTGSELTMVAIDTGSGNDTINVWGTQQADNAVVTTLGVDVQVVGLYTTIDVPNPSLTDVLTVEGREGNDTLKAAAGAEALIGVQLNGDDGNDLLSADATLNGGAGDDTFVVPTGTNTVNGGSGFDTIQVLGTGGDDTMTVDQTATNVNLTLNLSNSINVVTSIELVDLYALGGNDQVTLTGGGLIAVVAHGGDGNDSINASVLTTAVSAYGDGGNDSITGGLGNDSLSGGDGNDTLIGNGGEDLINGDAGGDVLDGGAGNDALFGGADADDLIPGTYFGLSPEYVDGGSGLDQVIFNFTGTSGLMGRTAGTLNVGELGATNATAFNATDVENVLAYINTTVPAATGFDMTIQDLTGSQVNFVRVNFTDPADANTLTMDGTNGDDNISADYVLPPGGEPVAGVNLPWGTVWAGSPGAATILNTLAIQGDSGDDKIKVAADLSQGAFGWNVRLDGGDGNDLLSADATITGGAGNDTLIASGLGDSLDGGAGDDLFIVPAGTNTVNGGTGFDTIQVDGTNGGDTISVNQAGGVATLAVNASASTNTVASIELIHVQGLMGNDTVTLNGSDTIATAVYGGDGNDSVNATGYAAATSLYGGSGDDTITGGSAADYLDGGDGYDYLAGGLGNDSIEGGSGSDQITYNAGDGQDVVDGGEGNNILIVNGLTAGANTFNAYPISGSPTEFRVDLNGLVPAVSAASIQGLNLNGGTAADTFNIADMTGTSLTDVTVNLGVDTVADTVNWTGTASDDSIVVGGDASNNVTVGGLTVKATVQNAAFGPGATLVDTVNVDGSLGSDWMAASQTLGAIPVKVGLSGGWGMDELVAAAPALGTLPRVTLNGGGNDDTFILANGNNVVIGSAGDVIRVDGTANNDTITAGGNATTLNLNVNGATSTNDITAFSGVVHVDAMGGNDSVTASGYLIATSIMGGDGNDTVDASGMTVAVTLYGGSGDDSMTGGSQADSILGESGNDTITGGLGNDHLSGGDDSDTFVWNNGDGSDTVEGGSGQNVQIFNGSATLADVINLTAASGRVVLSRTLPTAVTIDMAGVQTLNVNTLAGGDSVTVNSLAGTDMQLVNIAPGADADAVIVNGTNTADQISAVIDGTNVKVLGLVPVVDILSPTLADTLTINGLQGDDVIKSGLGVDSTIGVVLSGDEGNDTLSGDATLLGGAGNDSFVVPLGTNTIDGGAGNDTILVAGSDFADTITVTQNATVDISVTSGSVPTTSVNTVSNVEVISISALAGDDTILSNGTGTIATYIHGGDGNDTINATSLLALTTIYGGSGNDTLTGGTSVDNIYGEAGQDVISGGIGNDQLFGGDDSDLFLWNPGDGNDTTDGGSGTDAFIATGTAGSDCLDIAPDNTFVTQARVTVEVPTSTQNGSILAGNLEHVSLVGGAGADLFMVNALVPTPVTAVDIDMGAGAGVEDMAIVKTSNAGNVLTATPSATNATVDVNGLSALVRLYNTTLDDLLAIQGGYGDDTISVSPQTLTLIQVQVDGGGGDDLIKGSTLAMGGDGNDTLIGTPGNDTLAGGMGDDSISGLAGNDLLQGDAVSNGGLVGLTANFTCSGGETFIPFALLPITSEDGGNDTILGGTGNDEIQGNGGDDSILAGTGDDTVHGGLGNDYIEGNDGNDSLCGGPDTTEQVNAALDGSDTIFGGNGNDAIDGNAGDDFLNGGTGDDQLWGEDGNDTLGVFVYNGVTQYEPGNDSMVGGSGDDIIAGALVDAAGQPVNDGNDIIFGQDGNDTLWGGGGGDMIYGGNGEDVMLGGTPLTANTLHARRNPRLPNDGNDTMLGGDGFDRVDGGNGNNLLDAGDDGIRETILAGLGNDMAYNHMYTDPTTYDIFALDGGFNHKFHNGGLLEPPVPAASCDYITWTIDSMYLTGWMTQPDGTVVEHPPLSYRTNPQNGPNGGNTVKIPVKSAPKPAAKPKTMAKPVAKALPKPVTKITARATNKPANK